MIYITGDIHGTIDIHKLNTKRFPQQKTMTKNDYLIICGDFGLVWNNSKTDLYWRKWLENKKFTTLFVDGNHENHPLLNEFPEETRFGGKVHKISDSVFHLMRGQVYNIDGYKFFTMGGAASHDMWCRTEGVNWWRQELPDSSEYSQAIRNLNAVNWKVDFVITHCAPTKIHNLMMNGDERNSLTVFLQHIYRKLKFREWFCGHYHCDRCTNGKRKIIILYNFIMPLKYADSEINDCKFKKPLFILLSLIVLIVTALVIIYCTLQI